MGVAQGAHIATSPSPSVKPQLTAPAPVLTLPTAWSVVLKYRRAVMCCAVINLITIVPIVLSVRTAVVNGSTRFPWYLSWGTWPVIVLGVVFMLGPICGFIGARCLRNGLVTVYFGFACLQTASQIVSAVSTYWLSAAFFVLVQCWVTKIVSTFWYCLSMVPHEHRGELLEHKDDKVKMVYW